MKEVFHELSEEELRGLEAALKKIGKRAAELTGKLERLHLVLIPGTRLLKLPLVASPVSQFGLTRTRDLCRDSEKEGRNLQKTSVTDGFFWRCKVRSGTVIEPISNPRPLPKPLPWVSRTGKTGEQNWAIESGELPDLFKWRCALHPRRVLRRE
jgi:hypothetical protein